jgi:hypothetical protein
MKELRFLPLVFLFLMPIVLADGCGISCTSTDKGLLAFFIQLTCNTGTWIFCHALSLVLVIIILIIIGLFWIMKPESERNRIKLYGKAIFIILLLIMFFPTIKGLLFTSPFVSPPIPDCSDCCDNANHRPFPDGICHLNPIGNIDGIAKSSKEYYYFICYTGEEGIDLSVSGDWTLCVDYNVDTGKLLSGTKPNITDSYCFTSEHFIGSFTPFQPINVLAYGGTGNYTISLSTAEPCGY